MSKKKNKRPVTTETPRQDAFDSAWAKFRPLVPPEELAAVEESFSHPLCQAFRINPLKTDREHIAAAAERYGWTLEEISFCPDAYRVREAETLPSLSAEHAAGHFYIQDSASMVPVMLYDEDRIESKPLILDLAASPGGKTTHLCARSMDRGLILANDSSASRISALKNVLRNWGSVRHAVTNFPGESYGSWFPNTFDLILLDAPCSMQSLVSIDSHPMRPITEREEKALAQRQTALLESALRALKPGGQIVYSTCTLSPDEDEAVVDSVLHTFAGKIRVLDAGKRLPYPAPGLTKSLTQNFDPSVAGTVRLWPHRYETAGFFASLLEKTDDFGGEIQMPPERHWSKSSFSIVKPTLAADYAVWMNDQLGIDLDDLLSRNEYILQQRGDEIWMLPDRFLERFDTLPCKSIGMRAATVTPGGFVPDSDWVSRFFNEIKGERLALDPGECAAWRSGQDLHRDTEASQKGAVILLTDENGIFIGAGKVSSNRIRNFNKS